MSTKNSTTKNEKAQEVVEFNPDVAKHIYNTAEIDDFLDVVFHADLEEDENILTWASRSNIPAYPMSDTALLSTLRRVHIGKSLYYGTSTTVPDPRDGKLYNRKTLFKRFYVLVLDDIGTKIPVEKIPEDFKPTYIIESSEGNFQYGYVLEEPIAVLEEAEALVQLVYEAGVSDQGGKMATKLVRLPEGINGKSGDKGKFRVSLIELNDIYYTPDEILTALGIGVTWDQVQEDASAVMKTRASRHLGTAAWSPLGKSANSEGIIDPALEWLYAENMVKQETNDWVTIQCPWSATHTSGGDTAGYSPLGRGGAGFDKQRGFKCFHEHCAGHGANEFLQHIAANGAPELPVTEFASHLTSSYVFDAAENGVWQIKGVKQPRFIQMAGFKNLHPHKVKVVTADDRVQNVPEVSLFLNSLARVDVMGAGYDPTDEAKLVETDNSGELSVNLYTKPPWGDGDYDLNEVEFFEDFMKYLIPNPDDRKYFLDWLAAKAQSMAFRGAGILMVAKAQGTGRTTMANMLATMFGEANVEKVPFERLASSAEFNEWQTIPLIVTDETFAVGSNDSFYKVYERLKERIDTTPERIRINPKYGRQRSQMTYSSFLMFSNHENAMSLAHNDRRVYVMANPPIPAKPQFFTALHEWLDRTDLNDNPVWARHVWRWLRQREVDMDELLAPAAITAAKAAMASASKSAIEVAVDTVFRAWGSPYISISHVMEMVTPHLLRMNVSGDASTLRMIVRRIVTEQTLSVANAHKYRVRDKIVRLRLIPENATDEIIRCHDNAEKMKRFHPHVKLAEFMTADNLDEVQDHIRRALDYADF